MAAVNVPIIDPNNPGEAYGSVSVSPLLCGTGCNQADLTISANLSHIAQAPQVIGPTLPNGTPLPVGGLTTVPMVAIPVSNTGAVLYFAFGPKTALMGAAIPFAALDPAGKYVPGADLFFPMTFGPVQLVAGMFFGGQTDTTGVGVFLDLSSVIQSPIISNTIAQTFSIESSQFKSSLTFDAVRPSASDEQTIYRELYTLGLSHPTLQLKQ